MKINLNFKQLHLNTKIISKIIWINYQNCKKKLIYLKHLKRRTTAKSPLFLQIFVHLVLVSVFGLRPDVFSGQIFGFGLKWKTYFGSFNVQRVHLFELKPTVMIIFNLSFCPGIPCPGQEIRQLWRGRARGRHTKSASDHQGLIRRAIFLRLSWCSYVEDQTKAF